MWWKRSQPLHTAPGPLGPLPTSGWIGLWTGTGGTFLHWRWLDMNFFLGLHANGYIDGLSANFGSHSSLETYFPAYWLQILTAFSTEWSIWLGILLDGGGGGLCRWSPAYFTFNKQLSWEHLGFGQQKPQASWRTWQSPWQGVVGQIIPEESLEWNGVHLGLGILLDPAGDSSNPHAHQ